MSKDWDEPRWICGAHVPQKMVSKKLSKTASTAVNCTSELPYVAPSIESTKASKRLKPDKWQAAFDKEGRVVGFEKVLKAIIAGGADHAIRPEVWEFLLGCYAPSSTSRYRHQLREARRERYKELIEECRVMHASIGSGSLAYTVGSKVMDVRIMSKDNARNEAKPYAEREHAYTNIDTEKRELASDNSLETPNLSVETPEFDDNFDTFSVFEDSKESFENSNGCENGAISRESSSETYDIPATVLDSDDDTGSGESDGEPNSPASHVASSADYLCLPVRTLFPQYVVGLEADFNTDILKTDASTDNYPTSTDNYPVVAAFDSRTGKHTSLNNSKDNEDDTKKTERVAPVGTDDKNPWEVKNNDCGEGFYMQEKIPQDSSETLTNDEKMPVDIDEKVAEWLWTLHRIVVDVVRTDRHLKFYEDAKNLARMSDILAVYAWIDPATGYCQGMSDLLSPFIVLYKDDADAFWCFESLLRRVRRNFQMEGPIGVMKQLEALAKILELTDMGLFRHLVDIGADSFLFAFRMLLVLFRRELSFGEALCMWEMMWAADFDQGIAWALQYHCLEPLLIRHPSGSSEDDRKEEDFLDIGAGKPRSPLNASQELTYHMSPNHDDAVTSLSRSPLCGLRAGNFWPKHNRPKIRTMSSLLGNAGDDELSVFVVAAVLILNKTKFMKEAHSMDDTIKMFNDIQMKIKVSTCIRMARKLRKRYQQRLIRSIALERQAAGSNRL